MIEINLLPEEMRSTKRASGMKFSPKQILVGFFAIFFVAQVLLTVFSVIKQMELGYVTKELSEFKKQNMPLLQKKAEIAGMRARSSQIQRMTERSFLWSRLMNELSDSITKGVWLRTASLNQSDVNPLEAQRAKNNTAAKKAPDKIYYLKIDGSVVAKGQETAFIGRFIKELKSNALFIRLFDDVELTNLNQKKIKEVDVYDFSVICVFKKGMISGGVSA